MAGGGAGGGAWYPMGGVGGTGAWYPIAGAPVLKTIKFDRVLASGFVYLVLEDTFYLEIASRGPNDLLLLQGGQMTYHCFKGPK